MEQRDAFAWLAQILRDHHKADFGHESDFLGCLTDRPNRRIITMSHSVRYVLLISAIASCSGFAAHAAPTYTSSVFATAPAGTSGPDSVTVAAGSVWVAYDGNALSSDGSQPAGFSTVARYSLSGALQKTYQVSGDVDGLKYNQASGLIWATQNQDANSSVTLINPVTNAMTPLHYAVTSATQGVDDLVFTAGGTFLSTTNPTVASDPTLVKVVAGTSPVQVTTVATAGQIGTNIVTGATNYAPTVVNTDSLTVAPNGDLVQTTGNRDTLLFIKDAGLSTQSLSYLTLTAGGNAVSGTDDSLFLTSSKGTIFAAVSNTNQVLAIEYSGMAPGTLLASIGSLKEIGFIDQANGNVTPFVTGLSGIHGLDSISAVPEPANAFLMLGGLAAMLGINRRRAIHRAAGK